MISIPQLELQHATTTTSHIVVDGPKTVDVLCGRGKMCFRHEGNNIFRMLIAEHADTYKMASYKSLKMHVVVLIVEIVVASGGRFLVQNNAGTCWVDGGREQGKKKTGSALRDALRGRVKYITEMRKVNAQALRNESDNSSHSSAYDDRSEEFDLNNRDSLDTSMHPSMLEPSKDWMNIKVEKETANFLLKFFLAEQL